MQFCFLRSLRQFWNFRISSAFTLVSSINLKIFNENDFQIFFFDKTSVGSLTYVKKAPNRRKFLWFISFLGSQLISVLDKNEVKTSLSKHNINKMCSSSNFVGLSSWCGTGWVINAKRAITSVIRLRHLSLPQILSKMFIKTSRSIFLRV